MRTNRFPRETNMKRNWLTVMTILTMLAGLVPGSVFVAPLAAQVPAPGPELTVNVAVVNDDPPIEPAHNVYLPLVAGSGQPPEPPPTSGYAAALSQALADCAATALNQVCYGGGSVTLDGGGPLTIPGQTATLDGVSGLTLVSPDADHWSIALLRLAADSSTPDLGLTLLAFGNVEIDNLNLFDAAAGNWDVAPALSFSSSPLPGEDPQTGALIVYNPSDEEALAINLNGADLILASSAVVEAQPGVKMTVTMASGAALVSTAGGDSGAIRGQQLTVPLDAGGTAAGAPTAPTDIDEYLLEPLVSHKEDDLLTPLVPEFEPADLVQEFQDLLARFDSAYDRCMQGDSSQVYRVMWRGRMLRINQSLLPAGRLSLIETQVKQCATFELEFNSVVTGTSYVAWGSIHVQGQGLIVSYDMDGQLVQSQEVPLTHVRYDMDFVWPPECYDVVLEDGRLMLSESYMRINRNRLDISTTMIHPTVWERFIGLLPCFNPPGEMANPGDWTDVFYALHQSEQILTGFRFTPAHWKYTGNQILAEAIITGREVFFNGGVATGATWMFLLHKPGG